MVKALGEIKDIRTVRPLLITYIKDKDKGVRESALRSLLPDKNPE